MGIPRVVAVRAMNFAAEYVEEGQAVVTRHVEDEFLVQLLLPLHEHALGDEDQRAPDVSRKDQLPDRQAGLDRFAETYLVTEHKTLGKALDNRVRNARLVRPGANCAGFHPQTAGVE